MRLNWSEPGTRYFETGIDRGVFYPSTNVLGEAWIGLVSVSEEISGGSANPYYYDGVKYANVSSREEFGATIEAFSAPEGFLACDGTQHMRNGLFITQQARQEFNFSYRTRVGNDVDGVEYDYKIHLVYGALAEPTSRKFATMADKTDPITMSWKITTMPPLTGLHRPTSHLIIDSRYTPSELMWQLEDILYGTETEDPMLPMQSEIIDLFNPIEIEIPTDPPSPIE